MIPQIESANDTSDFDRIVNAMSQRLSAVSEMDYEALRVELGHLCVPLQGYFTPDSMADDLARIQALKDRSVAILDAVTNAYLLHKRVSEILVKGWSKFTEAKGQDKREGEAHLKMSQFLIAASEAESIYRYALGVVKNLESQQENVSRRITCLQASANIHGRIGAPLVSQDDLSDATPREDRSMRNWENFES
jgi:hypothetical protein